MEDININNIHNEPVIEYIQIWSNGAHGIEEPGFFYTQAFTSSKTKVFYSQVSGEDIYYVFFNEKFAYYVSEKDKGFNLFLKDMIDKKLEARKNLGKYK